MAKDKAKKLEEIKEKERQLREQRRDIEARLRQDERKRDTRRKILLGGAIYSALKRDLISEDQVRLILDQCITADRDRELFDLPTEGSQGTADNH